MRGVVAYSSMFVPPEWIAAFGYAPRRVIPARAVTTGREGLCPWAAAVAEELSRDDVVGAITVSTCDQLRRQAESIERDPASLIVMHVPATWEGDAARKLYRSELERVGRFLQRLGGRWPEAQTLMSCMRRFEQDRTVVPAKAEARGVPLAVVGGPLCQEDRWVLELIRQLGGRVALDATETGERGLPARYCDETIAADPMEAMVQAYFDAIPDAFRRPDTRLYEYLQRELTARSVRGIALVRYPWCDHWHAQVARMKETFAMPVIEIDLSGSDEGARQRIGTRLETLIRIIE